jgi:poly(A) polymerase
LNDTDSQPRPAPKIIPRSGHRISRAGISKNAVKVLYRLHNAGYQAFLVGGGVRDLLLGRDPKDFDVATDAEPDEVRQLFGNARLIGRRFKLAHVRFGRDIVEVVTFRAAADIEHDDRQHAASGRILRDNAYGDIEDDIWRRDFTVNALYYNIADFSVWDYTSGMEDIESRTLRLIGDPETRYREDPVRMLRAVRLAAKLDFTIAPETAEPIARLSPLLRDVPPARLFDETLKLFQAGHAARSFELLMQFGLLKNLFPHIAAVLDKDTDGQIRKFIHEGLHNTDQRVRQDQSVTPMFLYAILLWHPIRQLAEDLQAHEGVSEADAMLSAATRIVDEQQAYTSFPRRFSGPMKDVLVIQRRFTNKRGSRAIKLLEHKRFRAAYDFLLLRASIGEVDPAIAAWWTEVQELPAEGKRKAFEVKRRRGGKRWRRSGGTGRPSSIAQ